MPIIATIRPLESLRHAEWLANEVPTVRVPDALVERMRVAEQRGEETEEGIAIAQELARQIRPMVQGLHVTGAVTSCRGRPAGARRAARPTEHGVLTGV